MALKMKRPMLVLVPLSCAIAAAAILPPRETSEFYGPRNNVIETMLEMIAAGRDTTFYRSSWSRFDNTVSRAARRLDDRIARLVFEDTVRAMLVSPRSRRSSMEPIVIAWSSSISADTATAWLRLAERELSLYPRDPNHHGSPIAVLLVDAARVGRPNGLRRIVLNRSASPQCVVVLPLQGIDREQLKNLVREEGNDRRGSFVDWCGLFARFGTPGSRQGSEFITPMMRGSEAFNWYSDRLANTDASRLYEEFHYSARACRAGSESDCLHVALNRDDWNRDRGLFMVDLMRGNPASFGAYWRSGKPEVAALEEGYGRSAASLARDWVLQQNFQKVARGPMPTLGQLGVSGVWVGIILLAAAIGMTHKREGKKPWSFSLSDSPQ